MATTPYLQDNSWHLDKKVPIALIAALLFQFAFTVYYVSTVKNQGDDNNRRITLLEAQRVSERLASVESQLIDTKDLLNKIDTKLDRLVERTANPRNH